MEVATLLVGPRPTSERFLNSDCLNPWAQTSSGSCTKRLRGAVPASNIGEGREQETSVLLRHATRKGGAGPVRGRRQDGVGFTSHPILVLPLMGLKAPKALALLPGLKDLGFRA